MGARLQRPSAFIRCRRAGGDSEVIDERTIGTTSVRTIVIRSSSGPRIAIISVSAAMTSWFVLFVSSFWNMLDASIEEVLFMLETKEASLELQVRIRSF